MLSIENITVQFGGFTLLDRISFVLNPNERVALTGKNGAGKSTLLKIMAGLQPPTSGIVSILKEASIGYLPQQMTLSDNLTVREEASLALAHRSGWSRRWNNYTGRWLNAPTTSRTRTTRLFNGRRISKNTFKYPVSTTLKRR